MLGPDKGGLADMNPLMAAQESVTNDQMANIMRQAAGLGRTSMASQAAMGEMAQGMNQARMNAEQARMGALNQAQQNQMAAGQYLPEIAKAWNVPAGIDVQRLGIQQAYDAMNQNADLQAKLAKLQAAAGIYGQSWASETIQGPSPLSLLMGFLGPLLGAGSQFLGSYFNPAGK
jgi:hypothetical protein